MEKSFSEKVAEAKAAISAIQATEAHVMHTQGVVFVDPRPAEAIASSTGIIPGAHNVTLAEIERGELPAVFDDRGVQVVASCQGGPMGAIAAHALYQQGYGNVRYLDGGTQGWLDAGYETQR